MGASNAAFAKNSDFESRLKALETKYEKSSAQMPKPLLKAFKTAKITGRLHIDSRFYDENDAQKDTKQDGIDIKRARLGIKGKLSDTISYKFENDFAKNGSKIKDAYIAYDGIENTQFKIGQFKQFFSLEELTSSNNITFLDRSVAIDAAPSRSVGLGANTYGKNWQIAAGIFGESVGNESRDDDSKYSASVRATVAPINSNGNLIHLGLAATSSSKDRNKVVTSTTTTPETIDRENLYGAELALGLKSLSLQGEYIINQTSYDKDSTNNTITTNGKSATYESYYAQISYVLTGESRIYNAKSGTFKSVKVKNPVDKGGIGAWELAARVSQNDGNDDDQGVALIGGKVKEMTLGVNWYLNNNTRLMANYVSSTTDARTNANKEYDAFLVRAQFNF
jgi:phosphate-selective porin OprO/OprP